MIHSPESIHNFSGLSKGLPQTILILSLAFYSKPLAIPISWYLKTKLPYLLGGVTQLRTKFLRKDYSSCTLIKRLTS